MAERKIRFKVIEKYLTIAILAETLFFILFLIFSGAGNTGLKVFFAVMSLLHAIAILAFLYLRKEMFRPRCLWMSLASAAVVLLVLMALILNFPSPKPLAAPQLAALMMQLHI